MDRMMLDEAAIFNVARKLNAGAARSSYLDEVCVGNRVLRTRLEALSAFTTTSRVSWRNRCKALPPPSSGSAKVQGR